MASKAKRLPATYRASWLFDWYDRDQTACGKSTRKSVVDETRTSLPCVSENNGVKRDRMEPVNGEDIALSEMSKLRDTNSDTEEESKSSNLGKIVKDFASSTTAHGVSLIVLSDNWTGKLSWTLILVAALIAFTTQTLLLVLQYIEFNVNTKVELVSDSMRPFPAVTLCNTNKLRRSAVLESEYRELLIVDSQLVVPHYGPCFEEDFQCGSGTYCVRKYLVCDGINHCLDMSDERNCTYGQCGNGQFKCGSGSQWGFCIDDDYACDGKEDCYEGEDEHNCDCSGNEFQCEYSKRCISMKYTCDGVMDCFDGSDELTAICESGKTNVALGKQTIQSSTGLYESEKAVDGYTEGYHLLKSCSATEDEYEPWWAVDLGDSYKIHEVIVYLQEHNDFNYGEFNKNGGDVIVGYGSGRDVVGDQCGTGISYLLGPKITFKCGPSIGRNVLAIVVGVDDKLLLCEVQVLASELWVINAALKMTAEQSSDYPNAPARLAVDGIKNTNFWFWSCSQTDLEFEPWWRVDLGKNYTVYRVTIANRQDCCGERLSSAAVYVGRSRDSKELCGVITYEHLVNNSAIITVSCKAPLIGRYVSIQLVNQTEYLNLCEVEVYGIPLIEELQNVALLKPADQVSLSGYGVPSNAVDGRPGWHYLWSKSCIHTRLEKDPWWRVDLLKEYRVYRLLFRNRGDCCGERSDGVVFRVGSSLEIKKNPKCGGPLGFDDMAGTPYLNQIDCPVPLIGRYVTVQLEDRIQWMNFCELEVKAEEYEKHETYLSKVSSLSVFEEIRQRRLVGATSIDIPLMSAEQCAYECLTTRDIRCLSFNYEPENRICSLLVSSRLGDSGLDLVNDADYNHYERLVDEVVDSLHNGTSCPEGYFRCNSGECLHNYRVCDIIPQCVDGSDERNCTVSGHDQDLTPTSPWFEQFYSITTDQIVYETFLSGYRPSHEYHAVKGEDPPDWMGFKSYSLSPDYGNFDEILKVGKDRISKLGHQSRDFILKCSYHGTRCDASDFFTSQDEKYGNCFTFNHKGDRFVKTPGAKDGLLLTLFTEQEEYTAVYGKDSGVRVIIAPADLAPLPQLNGFTIKPGSVTSIAIRENQLTRMYPPWGNCTYGGTEDLFKVEGFQNKYSVLACENACVLNALEQYCGCTDSIHRNGRVCRLLDEDEDRCKNLIYYFSRNNMLPCDCRQPCRERQFSLTMSQSLWPSDVYLRHLLQSVHNENPKTRNINDALSARSNFVKLEIYLERLSYEVTSEYKAYTWEDLLSDIGGTLGLYIGLSVITVCEFIKFIVDVCRHWSQKGDGSVMPNDAIDT
ncbi:uncharacterized protein [Ptychodera flava]|uniref:uncharacterized protein n=1 Tax=Ptychodera flava TaxID=63121 RepID=UPI00396A5585